jgi:hypothetical protein
VENPNPEPGEEEKSGEAGGGGAFKKFTDMFK